MAKSPVRFCIVLTDDDKALLADLQKRTGLNWASVIRLALRSMESNMESVGLKRTAG